jgi:hypothetical protein
VERRCTNILGVRSGRERGVYCSNTFGNRLKVYGPSVQRGFTSSPGVGDPALAVSACCGRGRRGDDLDGAAAWKVAIASAIAIIFVLAAMRWVSANDPHRLNQYLMMLGRWSTGRRVALHWGHRTVSPIDMSRRAPPQPYD